MKGRDFLPVEGTRCVYERDAGPDPDSGSGSYRICLLAPDDLDREMRRHGLTPVVPTERVVRDVEDTHRVVTNGLFVKG
jgi:hypothetical protein